jgi:hypothetical protein
MRITTKNWLPWVVLVLLVIIGFIVWHIIDPEGTPMPGVTIN